MALLEADCRVFLTRVFRGARKKNKMTSTNKKSSSMVQDTPGSLTHKKKEKGMGDVGSPSPASSPFRRSGLLRRTPPSGTSQSTMPVSNNQTAPPSGVTISPPGAPFKMVTPEGNISVKDREEMEIVCEESTSSRINTSSLDLLWSQVDDADEDIENQLVLAAKTLKSIQETFVVQKNVNKATKEGIQVLEGALEHIAMCRRVRLKAESHLRGVLGQPPSPSESARQTRKRPRRGETPEEDDAPTFSDMATSPLQVANNTQGLNPPKENHWLKQGGKKNKKKHKTGKESLDSQIPSQEDAIVQNSTTEKRKPALAKAQERRGQKRPPTRNSAVVITPAPGKTYADVLSSIRRSVVPEESGTKIRQVRKTATGGVLIELAQCENQSKFQDDLKIAVGQQGAGIRSLIPRARLEVLDLDLCTTEEEVLEALAKELKAESTTIGAKISLLPPNGREQRVAVIDLDDSIARKLAGVGRLKVGWVSCRIRPRVDVERCYRCLGFGHTRARCKGPDRSRSCWKCGQDGHLAAVCTLDPYCALCATAGLQDAKHISGSGSCATFRKALDERKKNSRR